MITTNARRLRENMGISLRELSRRTGIAPGRLSYIERAIWLPDEDEVHLLSHEYGVPVEYEVTAKIEPRRGG